MDGEYVNVPDQHYKSTVDPKIGFRMEPDQRFKGLREFNNGVLVHNWFEERNKVSLVSLYIKLVYWNKFILILIQFEKKEYNANSTYKIDYTGFPGAVPDVVLRRKLIGASDGVGAKHLIGMHDLDSSKNMITW